MAMLIAVPPRGINILLGARRKIRVVVVNHDPINVWTRWPLSAVWSMVTLALTESVFSAYAVYGELLGRVRWSFNATPLVPQL